MLNHRPEHLDLATLDDLSLLQALAALPLAGAPRGSAVAEVDPLIGPQLDHDGNSFGPVVSMAKDFAETDLRSDVEKPATDAPDFLTSAIDPHSPVTTVPETDLWANFAANSGELASTFGQAVADAKVPTAGDLIFLDLASAAKGGNGKGKNGGGSTDGGSETGTISEYISGDPGAYNVEIDFKGSWTVDLQQAFIDSADYLSDIIVGDIADVFYRGKIIDDIRIDAKLSDIDGSGGILGQAGPTAIRTDGYLPATAVMEFDIADADTFYDMGLWGDIVLHEMLHSIGFGTIWDYKGLISGAGTDNPLFTGELAAGEIGAAGVPVEQDGGAGTRDSHWDEETFDNEIMTGYINDSNYVSDMTVASLEDLGYDTIYVPPDAPLIG